MSEPPPLDSWYGSGEAGFKRLRARGALLAGAKRLADAEDFAAYQLFRRAAGAVDREEARRIRGLIHAAAAGVKLGRGDARGAQRQLERARSRLSEGAPTLAEVDVASLLSRVEQRVACERTSDASRRPPTSQ